MNNNNKLRIHEIFMLGFIIFILLIMAFFLISSMMIEFLDLIIKDGTIRDMVLQFSKIFIIELKKKR